MTDILLSPSGRVVFRVSETPPNVNDTLVWNGTMWVPAAAAGATFGRVSTFLDTNISGVPNIINTGVSQWLVPPASGAGSYLHQTSAPSDWSLSSTTGILTYSGPAAKYQFNASVGLSNNSGATIIQIQAILVKNNALIGLTTSNVPFSETFTGLNPISIPVMNEFDLVATDTIRIAMRNRTNTNNLAMVNLNINASRVA